MNIVGTIKVDSPKRMLKNHGLDQSGAVQKFHTANVIRRIQKYMPFRSGATIQLMVAQSPISEPFVNVIAPYARFLYYGRLMVDPVTGAASFLNKDGEWRSWTKTPHVPKIVSDRPINYTTTFNPQAGPFWDRRLLASEKDAMRQDLQNYVDGRQV